MRLFSSSDKHSLQKVRSQHLVEVNLVAGQSGRKSGRKTWRLLGRESWRLLPVELVMKQATKRTTCIRARRMKHVKKRVLKDI